MRVVVGIVDVRDVRLLQSGRCDRGVHPVPVRGAAVDVYPSDLCGHPSSFLRLALVPRHLLHGEPVLVVHALPLLPVVLGHLTMVAVHHIHSPRVRVQSLGDVA